VVPTVRLELTRLSPPPPQDGVSTNFTTSATLLFVGWMGPPRPGIPATGTVSPTTGDSYFGISFALDASVPGAGTSDGGATGLLCTGWSAITPWRWAF
jgi:hypothetical protein